MKIALAQINPTVGDFEYNLSKILHNISLAENEYADLIVFSELVLCGYPPKDLLLKRQFVDDCYKYLNILKDKISSNILVIVGFPEINKEEGKPLFDSVAVIQNKNIICTRQKLLLPTYDVFDEDRYFEPGKVVKSVELLNKKFGLSVCEDIWHDDLSWSKPRYHKDPIAELKEQGIEILINSSSSPYFIGKPNLRELVLKNCAKKNHFPIVYVNQVGGNDELIFDGNSCVINGNGEVCTKLKAFEEDFKVVDLDKLTVQEQSRDCFVGSSNLLAMTQGSPLEEELLQAVILGLRDYVLKCGFKKAIIGLSGGIDSALVAVITAYALGKENVTCIFMPSRYTSNTSEIDAKQLANNLGVSLKTLSIEEPFKVLLSVLSNEWEDSNTSLAQENIQSRLRGLMLMALSNQNGALVLSTGNKSELATGYCTLYGDMCGGLAVISDLPKMMVYKLAQYINKKEDKELIPKSILTKAPTAELKPNQTDQDTLPPYEQLDKILNKYIEEHSPLKDIVKNGISKETVEQVCNMIDKSEYKREQAAPGLKLTSRSFGYGWRMPIAKRYKEEI